ncbi:MAG: sulfite exporter TauE/SafE family protein [Bacteroidota bacterium]
MNDHSTSAAPFRYVTTGMILFTLLWLIVFLFVFPDPVGLAAKHWPLVLVGVAGSFIGNITAIGGGLVFIPVLIFGYHISPIAALKLAFVTQAAGMTSGAIGWLHRGEVPLGLLKWTVPSLIIGTAVSTFMLHPNGMVVKSLFGPVSLLAGVLTLITIDRRGSLETLPEKAALPVFFISILGGLVTGWVAIGEGEIIAAFCMLVYGLRSTYAIGLGVVLLSINSIILALVHGFYFGGVPWDMAIFTIFGVLWGGRLGPYLSQWISVRTTKIIFAWIAMLDGALVSWQAMKALMN